MSIVGGIAKKKKTHSEHLLLYLKENSSTKGMEKLHLTFAYLTSCQFLNVHVHKGTSGA